MISRIELIIMLEVITFQLGVDIYLPSMPAMVHAFNTTSSMIQLTLTCFLLGASLPQLIFGPLSDRYGRKPINLIGCALITVATGWISFTDSLTMLLILRAVQGIGVSALAVTARCILHDSFAGQQLIHSQSRVMPVWALTPVVAPVVGGYLQHYLGWRYNFLAIFIVSAVTLLITITRLPETHQNRSNTTGNLFYKIIGNYQSVLTNRLYLGFCLMVTLFYSVLIAYNISVPFLYQDVFGLTPIHFGWVLLSTAALIVIGNRINVLWVRKMHFDRVILVNLLVMLAASLVMCLFYLFHWINLWAVLLPFAIMALAFGIILPNGNAGVMLTCEKTCSGAAGAVKGFLQMLFAATVTAILSAAHEQTQLPLVISAIALLILATSAFYFLAFGRVAHIK